MINVSDGYFFNNDRIIFNAKGNIEIKTFKSIVTLIMSAWLALVKMAINLLSLIQIQKERSILQISSKIETYSMSPLVTIDLKSKLAKRIECRFSIKSHRISHVYKHFYKVTVFMYTISDFRVWLS